MYVYVRDWLPNIKIKIKAKSCVCSFGQTQLFVLRFFDDCPYIVYILISVMALKVSVRRFEAVDM